MTSTKIPRRFYRDGLLDEMIDILREIDKKTWTTNKIIVPSTAILIELFEMNRLILKKIEEDIDGITKDDEWYQRLVHVAHNIQDGLRNAYNGIDDEINNVINNIVNPMLD